MAGFRLLVSRRAAFCASRTARRGEGGPGVGGAARRPSRRPSASANAEPTSAERNAPATRPPPHAPPQRPRARTQRALGTAILPDVLLWSSSGTSSSASSSAKPVSPPPAPISSSEARSSSKAEPKPPRPSPSPSPSSAAISSWSSRPTSSIGPRQRLGRLDLDPPVALEPRGGRDQLADDHVLLEAVEGVLLALERGVREHLGRLLEGGGRQERVRVQRRLRDAEDDLLELRGLAAGRP